MERKYGFIKQPDDYRDLQVFGAGKPSALVLPDEIDLEPGFPDPPYDQLQTSSCTGNGVAGIIQYGLKQAGLPAPMPSRLWLYGNGRKLEGDYGQDAGANIRDVIRGANLYGVIPETDWAFDETKVTAALPDLYQQAATLRIHFYASPSITSIDSLRMCLFHRYPIAFGFQVYEYFESQQMSDNPVLHLPTASEAPLGGHCVVLCGYDHANKRFKVRNSWGVSWAPSMNGYFWMDYDYVVSLGSDPWMNRFLKAAA